MCIYLYIYIFIYSYIYIFIYLFIYLLFSFESGARERTAALEADAGGKSDASESLLHQMLGARKLNEVFPQMVAFLQAAEKTCPTGRSHVGEV